MYKPCFRGSFHSTRATPGRSLRRSSISTPSRLSCKNECRVQKRERCNRIVMVTAPKKNRWGDFRQAFSTSIHVEEPQQDEETTTTSTRSSSSSNASMEEYRTLIYTHALSHVQEHGWTDHALAAGIQSAGLPPSMMGLVLSSPSFSFSASSSSNSAQSQFQQAGPTDSSIQPQIQPDLIHHFMHSSNLCLQNIILPNLRSTTWDPQGFTVAERLSSALQARLQMLLPHLPNSRWQQAMAIGALPWNAPTTATYVHQITEIVLHAAVGGDRGGVWGHVERTAVGGVYVAAELHLLADSHGYEDTWRFLQRRVRELESAARTMATAGGGTTSSSGGVVHAMPGPAAMVLSGDVGIAASALVTSLGGALLSLVSPNLGAGAGAGAGAGGGGWTPSMSSPSPGEYHGTGTSFGKKEVMQNFGGGRSHNEVNPGAEGSVEEEELTKDLPPFERDVMHAQREKTGGVAKQE